MKIILELLATRQKKGTTTFGNSYKTVRNLVVLLIFVVFFVSKQFGKLSVLFVGTVLIF